MTMRAYLAVMAAILTILGLPQVVQAQTFEISGVDFSDSVYLDEAELQAVAAPYVARPVEFDDLQKLLGEVQGLYSRAGIVTAQAIIPPQELVNGVLKIELVEASVETVRVEGFGRTQPDFLRRNVSLRPGDLPDFERLERDLRVFDLSHDVTPTISFEPGEAPGTTVAVIRGEAPKRNVFGVSLDNYGREETGEARLTLSAVRRNLTGVRDTLTAQTTLTSGSVSANIGYSRPVGPGGGRILGSLSYSTSQIIAGTFTPIAVSSDNMGVTLAYRRPIRVLPFSHVIVEGGLAYETSESVTNGLPFSDIKLTELYAQGSYSRRLENSAFSLSLGLRAGSAQAAGTTQTEGSFTLLYGSASYARPLTERFMFDGNLRFQVAPDQNLPVARLFSIGGVGSVRGYPNDIRSGDTGAVLNLQVSKREPFSVAGDRLSISPFAFVDIGVAVPFRATNAGFNSDQDLLYSTGLGALFDLSGRLDVQAVALIGVPLKETLGYPDPKARAYIGLDYKF